MRKLKCEEGQKFGYWTIISPEAFVKGGHTYVTAQCKCGKVEDLMLSDLVNGRSLGCKQCRIHDRMIPITIGGQYKDWTVIKETDPDPANGNRRYLCKCKCGTECIISSWELRSPNKRLRCWKCDSIIRGERLALKNGEIGGLRLDKFNKMKRSAQKRGISFKVSISFLAELFERQNHICAISGVYIPTIKDASLDRIDSTKGYIEGNVQWVTKQANLSKHTMTMNELYDFCNKVLSYANQKPSTPLTKCEGSETNS